MRLQAAIHWANLPRMKALFPLLLASSFVCVGGFAAEPANSNANAKTRALLNYFQGLSALPAKRMLSGQFTDFGTGAGLRLMNEIHEQTGHWPAIMGADYADFGKGGLTWEAPNQVAKEYWRQGGIVTLSAHLYNPANPNGGGMRR